MFFFFSSFACSLDLAFFSQENKCVCIFFLSFFLLAVCVSVCVTSNSLNEVFGHTQIKKIQKKYHQ